MYVCVCCIHIYIYMIYLYIHTSISVAILVQSIAMESSDGDSPTWGDGESDVTTSTDGEGMKCEGCPWTSKMECPIAAAKGVKKRLRWARERKWRYKNRTKRVPSGSWCRICYGLWRTHFRHEIKKLGDMSAKLKQKPFKSECDVHRDEYLADLELIQLIHVLEGLEDL